MTDTPDPTYDPGKLRASNADREVVAKALQNAMAEGRLTVAELQERLDTVYAAETLSELEPVTWDLPGHTNLVPHPPAVPDYAVGVPPAPPTPARIGGTATSNVAIAILSGSDRKGNWVVPTQFTAVAVMGGIELNLTDARYAAGQVTITAVAVMGGIDIIVPPDITVIVNGIGLLGAFEDSAQVVGPPGCPVVRVNGLALMGGVEVKRPKSPKVQLEK